MHPKELKKLQSAKRAAYFLIVAVVIAGIIIVASGLNDIINPTVWIETSSIVFQEERVWRRDPGRGGRWEWATYVEYVVDGERFRERLGSFTTSRGLRNRVTFYRSEANPARISPRIPPSGGSTVIFGIQGTGGVICLLILSIRRIDRKINEASPPTKPTSVTVADGWLCKTCNAKNPSTSLECRSCGGYR